MYGQRGHDASIGAVVTAAAIVVVPAAPGSRRRRSSSTTPAIASTRVPATGCAGPAPTRARCGPPCRRPTPALAPMSSRCAPVRTSSPALRSTTTTSRRATSTSPHPSRSTGPGRDHDHRRRRHADGRVRRLANRARPARRDPPRCGRRRRSPGSRSVRGGKRRKVARSPAARTGVLRLVDVTVRGNFAGTAGGGIFVDGYGGGSLVLERSTVIGNTTNGEGGGIHLASGRADDHGDDRRTDDDHRQHGPQRRWHLQRRPRQQRPASTAVSTLSRIDLDGNSRSLDGGGCRQPARGDAVARRRRSSTANAGDRRRRRRGEQLQVDVIVTRVMFSANRPRAAAAALFSHTEGDVTIDDSTFSANGPAALSVPDVTGDGGGGLAVSGSGSVRVTASSFVGNTSAGEGGGIAVHSDGPSTLSDLVVRAQRDGGERWRHPGERPRRRLHPLGRQRQHRRRARRRHRQPGEWRARHRRHRGSPTTSRV